MIQNNGLYISATERDAFDSLKIGADANNTTYYVGSNFDADTVPIPLQEGQSVDVSFDTLIVIDGEEPTIILQGKKHSRGFREGLQPSLTPAQMAAVNSGITAEKRATYDTLDNKKLDKSRVLTTSALEPQEEASEDVVPSLAKTKSLLRAAISIIYSDCQPKLTEAQLQAVNSGITNLKVAGYDSAKAKADASCKASKAIDLTAEFCITVSGDPAVVTRTRADVSGGNVFALTSDLFRMKREVDCSVSSGYHASTDYDYYFAFHADGKWVLTKEFTSEVNGVVSGPPSIPVDWDDEESENESGNEQSQSEQSQSTTDTVKGVTVQNGTPLDHYTGQPLCCVVAMRKDRQNLTESDIEALTGHKVYIDIYASRSQYIDVMLEQFNPHPWVTKNYDRRDELKAEFEVFPTFEQGETQSADGYPSGYDHYFEITINENNGNEIYNFLRLEEHFVEAQDESSDADSLIEGYGYGRFEEETDYIRIVHDKSNIYNQDFYINSLSAVDILEGERTMSYINSAPENAYAVLISIQNSCVVYAPVEDTAEEEEAPTDATYVSGASGTVTGSDVPVDWGLD